MNKLKSWMLLMVSTSLVCNLASAQETHHDHSSAPKFSNPDILNKMPANWPGKEIVYEKAHKNADLVIALGQQSYPIFKNIIKEYAAKRNLNIIVKQGTCGITAGRLRNKAVDVGAYCCPPAMNDRLPGLTFHSLGISPIALIVHPANPLTNVTEAQAKDIFSGKLSRWSAIGSKESKNMNHLIQPVGRLHCKIRPGHWRSLLKDEQQFSPRIFEVGVIADMMSQVSRKTGAIGWEVPLMVSHHKDKSHVRMLSIDGKSPTELKHLLNGDYPLYRSYSLTTWTINNKTNEQAHQLVMYMRDYIEKHHMDIHYLPPSALRKAGWKFKGNELVGPPG